MQTGIIKRQRVLLDGQEARPAAQAAAAAPAACTKKNARLVEHDGQPRAIEFTCSCGETTLVELEFGASEPRTERGATA